jgi:uncharacterized membrane protein
MSNIIINKKGQYYPRPSYTSVHPLLILGIGLFVLPFMFPIFGYHNTPQWVDNIFTYSGLTAIFIGAAFSIFKSSK